MPFLDANFILVLMGGLALVALGCVMVIFEISSQRSGRPFLSVWYKAQLYWLAYFCAFVLGTALLIKAVLLILA
jgi:hypothetical protein